MASHYIMRAVRLINQSARPCILGSHELQLSYDNKPQTTRLSPSERIDGGVVVGKGVVTVVKGIGKA